MGRPSVMLLAGLALLIVGFGFKIAAVPFHMWAPDVYDGSPTPVTAFMATGVKAAAFAALFRVLNQAFGPVAVWHDIVWWLAVVTMIGVTCSPWGSGRSSGCWRTRRSRTRVTCSSP